MDASRVRFELRKMARGNLLGLVLNQKISKCVLMDGGCGFHVSYKEFNFCIAEILGCGCPFENADEAIDKINLSLPLVQGVETTTGKDNSKAVGVYYRNRASGSMVFLGRVIERRKKERGNNFRDLLNKAVSEFSAYVADPSGIFLLASRAQAEAQGRNNGNGGKPPVALPPLFSKQI